MNPYQLSIYLSKRAQLQQRVGGGLRICEAARHGEHVLRRGLGRSRYAFPAKNYTVSLLKAVPIGSNVPIKMQVLITTAGTIYNNQI